MTSIRRNSQAGPVSDGRSPLDDAALKLVLILTRDFVPEGTAGRFRGEAFAEALKERGHDVHVICPVPNHPRGVVEEGFRGRPVVRRRVRGSHVTYLRVVTARQKTFWTRIGY